MKKAWFSIVASAIAILIYAALVLAFREGATKEGFYVDGQAIADNMIQTFPGANNRGWAVKNACGLFGEECFAQIRDREYAPLLSLLNRSVLEKYGFKCNEKGWDAYWDALNGTLSEDVRIVFFDASASKLTHGGIIATYCVMDPKSKASDTNSYHCHENTWLTWTLYFNGQGQIVSMLPCPEASIELFASSMGFEKWAEENHFLQKE